jgi:hypothetical protein
MALPLNAMICQAVPLKFLIAFVCLRKGYGFKGQHQSVSRWKLIKGVFECLTGNKFWCF